MAIFLSGLKYQAHFKTSKLGIVCVCIRVMLIGIRCAIGACAREINALNGKAGQRAMSCLTLGVVEASILATGDMPHGEFLREDALTFVLSVFLCADSFANPMANAGRGES